MSKIQDTRESELPKRGSVILPSSGSIGEIERPDDEVVPVFGDTKSYEDELAFMEEMVEVIVHKGQNKTDELIVPLGCNGVNQMVRRGEWTRIKRKYVAILAQARTETIETVEYVNQEGARDIRIDRQLVHKYPFQTRNDSARGNAWLQREMSGG